STEANTMAWAVPVAVGLSALGSFLNARSANKAAKEQAKRQDQNNVLISNYLNTLSPGSRDNLGFDQFITGGNQNFGGMADAFQGSLPSLPNISNVYRDLGIATDPILQSMRGGP